MSEATINSIQEHLESLGESYLFIMEMRKLSHAAAANDENAMLTLEAMIQNCGPETWQKKSYWCSAIIHALVNTGTNRSLEVVLQHINAFSETILFGPIELMSNLLPHYGEIVINPAIKMASSKIGSPIRAIGIQILCNLFLEGKLPDAKKEQLNDLLNNFQQDRYLTLQTVELVRSKMNQETNLISKSEIEGLFTEIIEKKS